MNTNSMSPFALQSKWFDELWGQRIESTIDAMVDDDCVVLGLPNLTMKGPELFRLFYTPVVSAFPETRVQIEDHIEQDDRIFLRCQARFTTFDGQTCEFGGGGMARFHNDKFVEAWNSWNWMDLFAQLGVAGLNESSFMDVMGQLRARGPEKGQQRGA